MKPEMIKKTIIRVIPAAFLVALSAFLLKGDVWTFWTWYLLAGVLGIVGMAVTGRLFRGFADKGWMFSKVVSITITGFLTWFLVSVRILKFTTVTCVGITAAFGVACIFLYERQRRQGYDCLPIENLDLVYAEEILFFAVFLLWTYLAGFHPAAHGTEKFMDYGFMEAMMRSKTLPATDLWYSQGKINYYYGGQYFAVFLTKLSGTQVELTYNLMRTMIAAFAFVLPFSLIRQMLKDRMKLKNHREWIAEAGGILAGIGVSMSGNLHYIIYGVILRLLKIREDYWFPDSTRYIGFDPAVEGDETIHEFPSYSFVLGDLHAHVINVFLVLLVLGILYAWIKTNKEKSWKQKEIGVLGLLLGMFLFSNTWDFMIYYVVICGTLFFGNLKRYSFDSAIPAAIKWSVIQWSEVLVIAVAVSLPFHLAFHNVMVQGVGLVQIHTAFYQFCVLWAFPLLVSAPFVIGILKNIKTFSDKRIKNFFINVEYPDLYGVVLILCAVGLIFIPEFFYVRDIYEKTAPRANTMFKLTYQAYIIFELMMAYILVSFTISRIKTGKGIIKCRGLLRCPKRQALAGIIAILLFVSTCGYLCNAINHWFNGFPRKSAYQTLNATGYLENSIPDDAEAIRWLNKNVKGQPVVLEACGDSYQNYDNRVSAMTGLPTVLGWYVHEWLWRNNLEEENQRKADVETIYTSTDKNKIQELIKKYHVVYLFIGTCEYEKYGKINTDLLDSLGQVVFRKGKTLIIKV